MKMKKITNKSSVSTKMLSACKGDNIMKKEKSKHDETIDITERKKTVLSYAEETVSGF